MRSSACRLWPRSREPGAPAQGASGFNARELERYEQVLSRIRVNHPVVACLRRARRVGRQLGRHDHRDRNGWSDYDSNHGDGLRTSLDILGVHTVMLDPLQGAPSSTCAVALYSSTATGRVRLPSVRSEPASTTAAACTLPTYIARTVRPCVTRVAWILNHCGGRRTPARGSITRLEGYGETRTSRGTRLIKGLPSGYTPAALVGASAKEESGPPA